ncbi:hypothetical protein MKJ04_16975 [Pontibacter sp. E15-1]|uniref:hypothetical protein n=1 Tax=Pontibacter sp. E15-1 TaxID=2919918 RepID=UPI001F4F23A6|nr:hypothetical protein [Pontibacter sp. E15-1]MCJ8166541.1 hypothetical protein [Pontibacter sp. E15-1]
MAMSIGEISIELTNEEAIVFYEFLSKYNKIDDLSRFQDLAEQRVLWDIECKLEKEMSEPFQADYQEIVKKARNKVRDGKE